MSASADQVGVLPYRSRDGALEVLLITSRTRRRWIIPKGNIESDLTPRESAIEEAYEEAGVRGEVPDDPIGSYAHGIPPGTKEIALYLMQVDEELDHWPEEHQRRRRWVPLEGAQKRVFEDGLKELMNRAEKLVASAQDSGRKN